MKYRCMECGKIFDQDELARWEESRGEFWGMPCTETMIGCPACHSGDYEEYDPEADEDEVGEDDDGRKADQ